MRRFKIGQRIANKHWPDSPGTIIGYAEDIRADGDYWYWCHFDGIGDPETGGVPEAESDLIEHHEG